MTTSLIAAFTGGFSRGMQNPACFVAGTMILTSTGLVAIENIKAGDKVISTNVETFETTEKAVLETYIRKTTELVNLTISGGLIQTTFDHPFYIKNCGFVNAKEIRIGDELLDSKGNVLLVENTMLEFCGNPVTVYNFRVKDFHTYHVGYNDALVHNAGAEYGKPYTEEQQKLVEEGRAIDKRGSISRAEAENYVDRSRAIGFNENQVRLDEGHMQRMDSTQPRPGVSGKPHLHVPAGKNHSIPIIDK